MATPCRWRDRLDIPRYSAHLRCDQVKHCSRLEGSRQRRADSRMDMKRLIGAVIVLAILAAAAAGWIVRPAPVKPPIAGSGAVNQVSFQPEPIEWFTCGKHTLRVGTFPGQCGYLRVPLDYAHPEGTTITIALTRIQHTSSAAQYQGVMLVNPGGPGGEGIAMPLMAKHV